MSLRTQHNILTDNLVHQFGVEHGATDFKQQDQGAIQHFQVKDHQPSLNDEDDTAGWTMVTNTRKQKQHNKKVNDPKENIIAGPVLDQSTLSTTDGELGEWHIKSSKRRPKKCRKNPYYSGNKAASYLKHHPILHLGSDRNGRSKHRFKNWAIDIIVLPKQSAARLTQHMSKPAHKEIPRLPPARCLSSS